MARRRRFLQGPRPPALLTALAAIGVAGAGAPPPAAARFTVSVDLTKPAGRTSAWQHGVNILRPPALFAVAVLAAIGVAGAGAPPPAAARFTVSVDLTRPAGRTSAWQHGVNIDTFSLTRGLDFSSPALLGPARELAPAVVRVGGSAQRSFPPCLNGTEHPESWNASCLTASQWRALCGFADAVGADLLYGLDPHAMDGNVGLLESDCPALAAVSLGNEGVPGSAAQFKQLRAAIGALPQGRRKPALVGPDAAITPSSLPYFVPLATKIIQECGGALDVASFHVYSFFGWQLGPPSVGSLTSGNLSHLWDPRQLRVAADMVRVFRRDVLGNTSFRELPMWLTETNSICEGGVNNLTNAYANVPWLLNQLGAVALAGVDMMGHQTLVGEDYGLLSGAGDRAQGAGWLANVTARPNFFALLLHRRLVGATVLNASLAGAGSSNATAAVYAYCAANQTTAGAVAVVLINFAYAPASFALELSGDLHVYGLFGRPKPLPSAPTPADVLPVVTSSSVHLNGGGPLVVGAPLEPLVRPAGQGAVAVPGLGAAIVVAPSARAAACAG